ncbi:MAG: hypothetical protein MEQ74_00910 [Paracoccus sp.]|nr:hypothetical protein [Paracoccus sp. (in: a-proteobacteria)]
MADANIDSRNTGKTDPFPDWVIKYVIALSAYAESRDLPEFESKIAQATEALLRELNEKQLLVKDQPNSILAPIYQSESLQLDMKAAV